MKPVIWKILAGIVFLAAWAGAGTPYWIDKDGKKHNTNVIPASKAKGGYGVDVGAANDYVDGKLVIKVHSRCWFLTRKGPGGWKRNEWKRIGDKTVEIHTGESLDLGEGFGDITKNDQKTAWNVFGADRSCSPVPNIEEWIVKKKIKGRWVVTARQRFYIEP